MKLSTSSKKWKTGTVFSALYEKGEGDALLKNIHEEIYQKVYYYILKNSGDEDDAKDMFQEGVMKLLEENVKPRN